MCKTEKSKDTAKKNSSVGKIICIANNSLEVCLIGLAPSENAIARKFATVWVDAKKKFATKVERTETTGLCGLIEVFSITSVFRS